MTAAANKKTLNWFIAGPAFALTFVLIIESDRIAEYLHQRLNPQWSQDDVLWFIPTQVWLYALCSYAAIFATIFVSLKPFERGRVAFILLAVAVLLGTQAIRARSGVTLVAGSIDVSRPEPWLSDFHEGLENVTETDRGCVGRGGKGDRTRVMYKLVFNPALRGKSSWNPSPGSPIDFGKAFSRMGSSSFSKAIVQLASELGGTRIRTMATHSCLVWLRSEVSASDRPMLFSILGLSGLDHSDFYARPPSNGSQRLGAPLPVDHDRR